MPKSTPIQSTPPQFVRLRDFLSSSSLSYTTYRRLRERGQTPPEYKLSSKVILLKKSEVSKWVRNPLAIKHSLQEPAPSST